MSWIVEQRHGLYLPQIGWWLDASKAVDRSFVSHAHFDHLGRHREIICTAATSRFIRTRQPSGRNEHLLAFGQTEQLTPDCTVTLYPAGHILGSAQILLDHREHGRLLYTGDFKLRPGHAAEVCATPRADVLIMETTFGRPHYTLPPSEEVFAAIADFCREALADDITPLLFCYSLGKSQEVLRGLAPHNLPVMLHAKALELTRAYEELGMTMPAHKPLDPADVSGHVVICPPQAATPKLLAQIPRHRTAVITGWAIDSSARYRYRCDAAFALSDHADYPDLLRFVEIVNPKLVYTVHGFVEDFARDLRQRGREAWAIGRGNQLEMPL